MGDRGEIVQVELTRSERDLLERGLVEWGGPAYCTEALAVAMGFESVADFSLQQDRLLHLLRAREPLSAWDWTRVLFATEIVFASDTVGSGVEWQITTGFDDSWTLSVLRDLQRKLISVTVPIGPRGA